MRYLIGGQLREWDGPFSQVHSPILVDRKPFLLGRVPQLTEQQATEALEAAAAAYAGGLGAWPAMSPKDRIGCLRDFVRRMRALRIEVVRLLMWEICKVRADAEKEFDRTVEYIEDTIEQVEEMDRTSSSFLREEGFMAQIRRCPLGVVLCMGPFNYPLNETYTTLIPALVMGNTVVAKPPKFGVLLHAPLLEAFRDSFPPGGVNFISGEGPVVIGPIMKSGKVQVLAFIGTSRVSDILRQQHPYPHRLRCVLGLEAKNPAFVLPDADLDEAVRELTAGALSYNGQRCTAIKMIFVHESIGEEFLAKLTAAVDALKPGLPWQPGVRITPLPEQGKPQWLQELVSEAVQKGARMVNRDGGLKDETFFFPAVIHPATPEMKIYHVEQFGPLVPVAFYKDEKECVDYVVHSPYGQQASIYGRDPARVGFLIDSLANQVARINLNSQCQRGPDSFPFTGRKDSAEGTLSVYDALRSFSIRTVVAGEADAENESLITDILRHGSSRFLGEKGIGGR
jgi:glyceraldehyde-3-phosphate dehydrogenase (NADP+)